MHNLFILKNLYYQPIYNSIYVHYSKIKINKKSPPPQQKFKKMFVKKYFEGGEPMILPTFLLTMVVSHNNVWSLP